MVVRIGICRGSNEAGLLGTQDCAGMPGRAAGGGGAVGGQGGSHVVDCFEFQAEEFILDFIANRE